MKEKKFLLMIILFFLFLIEFSYAEDKIIFLNIVYFTDSENIKFDSMYVNYGSEFVPPVNEDKTVYSIKILDQNINQLYSKDFSLEFVVLDAPISDNITTILMLPYYPNAKTISISKLGKEILTINLELLCNNNGICDNYENYFSCMNDCHSGSNDGTCDKVKDGICDPDCAIPSYDPDCITSTTVTTTVIENPTTTTQVCNKNNKCEPQLGENYITCLQDCPSGPKTNMTWIYIVLCIAIVALLVFFLTRIKGEKIERRKQIAY